MGQVQNRLKSPSTCPDPYPLPDRSPWPPRNASGRHSARRSDWLPNTLRAPRFSVPRESEMKGNAILCP